MILTQIGVLIWIIIILYAIQNEKLYDRFPGVPLAMASVSGGSLPEFISKL